MQLFFVFFKSSLKHEKGSLIYFQVRRAANGPRAIVWPCLVVYRLLLRNDSKYNGLVRSVVSGVGRARSRPAQALSILGRHVESRHHTSVPDRLPSCSHSVNHLTEGREQVERSVLG